MMSWKAALAVAGGLLGIFCGEAVKQELTHWAQLASFPFWMGCGVQLAGLISVFTGGLYTAKPGSAWDGVTERRNP